jgi:hypothetical protein
MRDLFEVNSRKSLIDFYGVYPSSCANSSIQKDGLLYRFMAFELEENPDFSAILGSFDSRDFNICFSALHVPTGSFLDYSSDGTFRGVSYEFEDIFHESLSVRDSCFQEKLDDKIGEFSFLKEGFERLKRENPSSIAPEEIVRDMRDFQRQIYKYTDDSDFC